MKRLALSLALFLSAALGAKAQERSVPLAGLVIGDDMRSVVAAGTGDEDAGTESAGDSWSPAMQAVSEVQIPWGAQ